MRSESPIQEGVAPRKKVKAGQAESSNKQDGGKQRGPSKDREPAPANAMAEAFVNARKK